MPSLEENISVWGKTYDWKTRGDEWSEPWGGTDFLWHGTIFPRIFSCVPADTILEIAPGYGRCTQFLLALCRNLQIVDLNVNCIDHCKKRFSKYSHIHYSVNNGKTLETIDDNSVDFIFSWDSLVHCEADVLDSYIREWARVLRPDGRGFIHHSNIGAYRNPLTGKLRCENIPWRAVTMTAPLFNDTCRAHGLRCIRQETVNWGGNILNDCFSVFTKNKKNDNHEIKYFENTRFHEERERMAKIAHFYSV
ncbi:MAG: class I SAM-dependent methyltransferase [Methanoregula sp.]|nr:class I SAM-dependent methyltransferase [Methanoregula sp.]